MTTITTKDFDKIFKLCRSYDPFTQYIDSYTQEQQAKANNDRICDELDAFFKALKLDAINHSVIWLADNSKPADKAEQNLRVFLESCNVAIVDAAPAPAPAKAKHVWTEDEIAKLVQTNDKVTCNALAKLYACQTADEQAIGETRVQNGMGFNGADSRILSSMAEFFKKTGFLTPKQLVVVRRKLVKYNKQLTRIANA